MPICKTEAITLSRSDYSETSQVVTLFTRDFGKVRVIAKGAKRPKSLLEGAHDLLGYCEVVYYQRTRGVGLQTLTERKLLDDFRSLRTDLKRSYTASYASELVNELCPEGEPNGEVFALFLETLRRLAAGEAPELLVARFELQLYRLLGYAPELAQCAACKKPLRGRRVLRFSPLKGGALCADCVAQDRSAPEISAGALSAMRMLASSEALPPGRLKLPRTTLCEIRAALNAQVCSILEREPRTLRYIQIATAGDGQRSGRPGRIVSYE